jgi:hypothetical protein
MLWGFLDLSVSMALFDFEVLASPGFVGAFKEGEGVPVGEWGKEGVREGEKRESLVLIFHRVYPISKPAQIGCLNCIQGRVNTAQPPSSPFPHLLLPHSPHSNFTPLLYFAPSSGTFLGVGGGEGVTTILIVAFFVFYLNSQDCFVCFKEVRQFVVSGNN